MIVSNKLAYLYGIIIFICLELSLFKPNLFWVLASLALFFTIFFTWLCVRRKWNQDFYNFLISPFLFILSAAIFLSFSGNYVVNQIIILFSIVANTLFFYHLINYFFHKHLYKQHALSNISRVINLTTIFFYFTDIANLQAFFKTSIYLLLTLTAVLVYLIVYQYFSISKIRFKENQLYIIINTFIIIQIFYVTTWLPIISPAKAILITSAYYTATSLTRHYIESTLARSVYLRYSMITGLIWFLTLITSRFE